MLLAGRFEVRGSCAYTLRLAEHLGEFGFDTTLVCADARLVDSRRRSQLPIREYGYLDAPFLNPLVLRLLARDLGKTLPDLIHIQSRSVLPQGSWLARRLRRPFVLTVHDYLQPGERLDFDAAWGRRIVAVSDSVKSELVRQAGIPDDVVTVVPSGVECFDPAVPAAPVLDSQHIPVVGTAGPLEAVKGLPFFLGAAQKVLAVREPVEFLIAGAGPEEGNLRRLARDLGVSEHVTFAPNVLDFSSSLEAMDIFCLPSLRQGLGTIMLEAMARGKPVIATNVGGVYSVVRNREMGLTVEPSNSRDLAQKILELLDHPEFARRVGQNARGMVREHFSVGRMVRETAGVYDEALCTQKSSHSEAS